MQQEAVPPRGLGVHFQGLRPCGIDLKSKNSSKKVLSKLSRYQNLSILPKFSISEIQIFTIQNFNPKHFFWPLELPHPQLGVVTSTMPLCACPHHADRLILNCAPTYTESY